VLELRGGLALLAVGLSVARLVGHAAPKPATAAMTAPVTVSTS
jgi:hypothetical protein